MRTTNCRICGGWHPLPDCVQPDYFSDPDIQWALRTAKLAMQMKTPALALIPCKTLLVCRSLRMSEDATIRVLDTLDAKAIVIAALDNPSLARQRRVTADGLCTNPPMRVEFEHTIVFGAIGEAGELAKHKSWGKTGILRLDPLRREDVIHPLRITYHLKPTSHMRQRWEWRDTLKHMLRPKRYMDRGSDGFKEVGAVRLVNDAMRYGKAEFLIGLTADAITTIRQTLDMPPDEFWIACRYGERRGVGSITKYVNEHYEKTKGYTFDFGEPTTP